MRNSATCEKPEGTQNAMGRNKICAYAYLVTEKLVFQEGLQNTYFSNLDSTCAQDVSHVAMTHEDVTIREHISEEPLSPHQPSRQSLLIKGNSVSFIQKLENSPLGIWKQVPLYIKLQKSLHR